MELLTKETVDRLDALAAKPFGGMAALFAVICLIPTVIVRLLRPHSNCKTPPNGQLASTTSPPTSMT